MKQALMMSVALIGLAGLAGCADKPPAPPAPVAEAAPPPPPPPATRGPVDYVCRRHAGDVMATFVETNPETVQLTYKDQTETATRVPTKRGMLYKADGVSFYVIKNGVTVNWMGKKLSCYAHKA